MLPPLKTFLLRLFILIPVVLVLATGCDQARENVAAIIKPKTLEEVTASVNDKVGRRAFSQARMEGVEFLNGKDDTSGRLAWALAKACAQTGERDLAIKYTEQALKADVITAPQAMGEPLLEPVRDEIRFVSLLAGVTTPGTAGAKPTEPVPFQHQQSRDAVTATIDAKGIEARAGEVVVKLPN